MASWSYPDDDAGSWTDGSSSPGKFDEEYHPIVSDHNDRTSYIATPLKNVVSADREWSVLVRFDESTHITFSIRGQADPSLGYFNLHVGAKTAGRQLNHVVLMEIHVVTHVVDEFSKPYIVHFSEQCPSYVLRRFMRSSDMYQRLSTRPAEAVEFRVFLSLNSDPDYFCHEVGHRKTLSCELAKRTFKWAKIRRYYRLPSINTILKRPIFPAGPGYRLSFQSIAPTFNWSTPGSSGIRASYEPPSITRQQSRRRKCILICDGKGFLVDWTTFVTISRTAKRLLPRVPYKRGAYYLKIKNGSLETLRIFIDFINGKRTWRGAREPISLVELRQFALGNRSIHDTWKSFEMRKLLMGLSISKSSLRNLCVAVTSP